MKQSRKWLERILFFFILLSIFLCLVIDFTPKENLVVNLSVIIKILSISKKQIMEINKFQTSIHQYLTGLSTQTKKKVKQEIATMAKNIEYHNKKQELIAIGTPKDMTDIILAESINTKIPYLLLAYQIKFESNFDCYAVSPAGAYGPCQIRVAVHPLTIAEARNPKIAIPYQAKLMKAYYKEFKSWRASLICYNAGINAYKRYEEPMSSQIYAQKILSAAKI